MKVRLATRGSALALIQAHAVADRLKVAVPDLEVEIVTASTPGDRDKSTPLTTLGQGDTVTRLSRGDPLWSSSRSL